MPFIAAIYPLSIAAVYATAAASAAAAAAVTAAATGDYLWLAVIIALSMWFAAADPSGWACLVGNMFCSMQVRGDGDCWAASLGSVLSFSLLPEAPLGAKAAADPAAQLLGSSLLIIICLHSLQHSLKLACQDSMFTPGFGFAKQTAT